MPRCLLCHHAALIAGAMVLLDRSGVARQGRYQLCQRCYASGGRTSKVRRALVQREAAREAARSN